jgi:hypothetical protein
MVELVREVKVIALLLKHHDNVTISMRSNMEVSWDSVNFKRSFLESDKTKISKQKWLTLKFFLDFIKKNIPTY